jgi:hypothetical protein
MTKRRPRSKLRIPTGLRHRGWALAAVLLAGCGGGPPDIPDPRPIVIHSGARLRTEKPRMREINAWVTREQTNITEDPSFLVETRVATEDVYPWDGLTIQGDTVRVYVNPEYPDARLVFEIYGHLHLMAATGKQAEWLPEAPDATGYELERAIVKRVAEAWLLGRTVFDTTPYGPLDEIMWANEDGYLDALIFTARPDDFGEARAEWARNNPNASERYRSWFQQTFNREPPGMRSN